MIRSLLFRLASPTPYFHLPAYMNRWWLLGAQSLDRNKDNTYWTDADRLAAAKRSKLYRWLTTKVAVRLHEVMSSDRDRHLHDHPCANISIVLSGGYWELMPIEPDPERAVFATDGQEETRAVWRGPGAVVFRRASDRHRLVLPEGAKCWSVFILGKKKSRSWGFYTPEGFVLWRKYLGIEEVQPC